MLKQVAGAGEHAPRRGRGGRVAANEDADLSQNTADVLRELDKEIASNGGDGKEESPVRHNPVSHATWLVTLEAE